jgi:catechol 2,3-dioxygenase-like lactoylglutathione lyase family enzyme
MLNSSKVVAFVPTTDFAAARAFYHETLGLPVVSEDGFALVVNANGTHIRVTRVQELQPASFTVLGWEVEDIRVSVRTLSAAGVSFMRVEGLPQDDLGVWDTSDGSSVAWFKDPDGNTLSLTQYA